MITALTIVYLTATLGARLLFYMPLRRAMGYDDYDQVSFALLGMMYWGFVAVVTLGYVFGLTRLMDLL